MARKRKAEENDSNGSIDTVEDDDNKPNADIGCEIDDATSTAWPFYNKNALMSKYIKTNKHYEIIAELGLQDTFDIDYWRPDKHVVMEFALGFKKNSMSTVFRGKHIELTEGPIRQAFRLPHYFTSRKKPPGKWNDKETLNTIFGEDKIGDNPYKLGSLRPEFRDWYGPIRAVQELLMGRPKSTQIKGVGMFYFYKWLDRKTPIDKKPDWAMLVMKDLGAEIQKLGYHLRKTQTNRPKGGKNYLAACGTAVMHLLRHSGFSLRDLQHQEEEKAEEETDGDAASQENADDELLEDEGNVDGGSGGEDDVTVKERKEKVAKPQERPKSEGDVRGESKETATTDVVTETHSPPSKTKSYRAEDSSAPDKMTVLTAPKLEPTSSGHLSDVSKSEANLRGGSKEEATIGVVTESLSPPSRTTPNRADDSSAPDEVVDKRHERNCLSIVALPVVADVAPISEAQMREDAEEPRRTSELDHVLGALSDAKSAAKKVGLKWQALRNVMHEKKRLKAECEEGKELLDVTRRILSRKKTKVQELESERHATLTALNEKDAMLNGARDEAQRMHQEHDAVVADICEQMQELEANRDTAVSEMWGQKREFEAKCNEMQREADNRCDAMQREAGNRMVAHSEEKLRLRRELHAAMNQKTQFEGDLRKVLAEKQQLEHNLADVVSLLNYKTQQYEMDRGKEAALTMLAEERVTREREQEENRVLNVKLVDAQNRMRKLEVDLASMREDNNRLRTTQETIVRKLHEGHRKTLCQICCVSPKDTVTFPCLHLHFCFACLEKHYKLNRTCPSCKMSVNCYMRCNIVP